MKIIILAIWAFIFCSNLQFTNAGSNLRTSFDQFRSLTNRFLNTIQPNNGSLNLTANLISNITGNYTNTDYKYYINLYWQPYVGYIILIIIGILFFVFFPLVGMCFCCCRVCCKQRGAKTEAVYNMKRKRIVFNIFLLIFTSLILIGAIVAMASNFVFRDAFNNTNNDSDGNFLYNFNTTVAKFINYINSVRNNISGPGLNLIAQVAVTAPSLLSPISTVFIQNFRSGISFDSLLQNAYALTQTYVNLQTYSKNLSDIAGRHQPAANDFTAYLSNFNNSLSAELTSANCGNSTYCNAVLGQIPSLILGFNMSNINYVADISAVNVTNSYNVTNLNNSIGSITNTVVNVTNDANSTFMNYINSFINNLNSTTQLMQLNNTINSSITVVINYINDFSKSLLATQLGNKTISDGVLYDYVTYVFYGFCVLISIILLVVLLFFVGLCFGICGAPNFEDASCCNKGKGGGFLMAAVTFSFLFGSFIMLITMIMFLIGGLANTEVCRILTAPTPSQTAIVDSIISPYLKNVNLGPVSLSNISVYQSLMIGCQNSPNLISALQISDSFMASIVTYIQTNFIDAQINQTITSISNYNVSTINTTDLDSNINNIQNVVNQLMTIVSPQTQNELKKPVILVDVQSFVNNVNQLMLDLNKTNKNDVAIRIQNAMVGFQPNVTAMNSLHASYLLNKIQFDTTATLINSTLLTNVKESLSLLKSQPSNARNKAILAAADSLRSIVKATINQTLYGLFTVAGDCKGASNSVNSAVNIFCVIILGPFNNIWMGMGWFLLFIIPAIIFAVKLTGIYRITHVETESAAYK